MEMQIQHHLHFSPFLRRLKTNCNAPKYGLRILHPPSNELVWKGERYNHDRIRIAYFSSDFQQHAIGFILQRDYLNAMNKSRFEVTAISGQDLMIIQKNTSTIERHHSKSLLMPVYIER